MHVLPRIQGKSDECRGLKMGTKEEKLESFDLPPNKGETEEGRDKIFNFSALTI